MSLRQELVEGMQAKTPEQATLHPEQNKNIALKEQPWAQMPGRKNPELTQQFQPGRGSSKVRSH